MVSEGEDSVDLIVEVGLEWGVKGVHDCEEFRSVECLICGEGGEVVVELAQAGHEGF